MLKLLPFNSYFQFEAEKFSSPFPVGAQPPKNILLFIKFIIIIKLHFITLIDNYY